MYQKILLCYDGSPDGREALREGAEIARNFGAQTHLLAIAPLYLSTEDLLVPQQLLDADRDSFKQVLDEGVACLRNSGIDATGHLMEGRPIEVIARFAREMNVDLIVLGHRHQSALARWWRGSVGSSLVDLAPCSILVAVQPARAAD